MHSIRHLDKFYNHPDALHTIFILIQTHLSRRSCCVATKLHRPHRYISFESIWLTPSKTISATWLDTQSVTRPPRASPLGWTRGPSLGHLAHPHSSVPHVATRLCMSSPLGRSARRLSVVHAFTTWPLRASPLGWTRSPSLGHLAYPHSAAPRVATRLCTSSPLGRPARCHSVVHVFTTWPLRASPLGCACLHHMAAPRITTWMDT